VTTPRRIWTRISAATTQKYFSVAFCEGVAAQPRRGSSSGRGPACSSRCEAYHQTIALMPASSRMTLTPVQTTASPVGRLPTSGSCGQFWVYEIVSPGRLVTADHAVQKKNAERSRSRSGSVTAPAGIAYASTPSRKTAV
jgi:hypothetical protein